MEATILFLKFLFAAIFISTALSKMQKIEEHKEIVKQYKILPESLLQAFVRVDIAIQLAVSIFLLLGIFHTISCSLLIMLLLLYSLAISFNLIRGRREISCGCGGLVGNHKLSWWLVMRNLLLILVAIWLYNTNGTMGNFGWPYFFTLIFAITTLLGFISVKKVMELRKRIEELFLGI